MLPILPQAHKHYAKYATSALKAANLPKNIKNLKGDIPMNTRNMAQVGGVEGKAGGIGVRSGLHVF